MLSLSWSWDLASSRLSASRSRSFSWMMARSCVSCLLMAIVISTSRSPRATTRCCSATWHAAAGSSAARASSSDSLRVLLTSEVRVLAWLSALSRISAAVLGWPPQAPLV